MHFTAATAATLLGAAAAKTVKIEVGEDGLSFEPKNAKAEMGDMLEFHFYPQKHSVVMGDPDNACHPVSEGGFYSGFIPSKEGPAKMTFNVMVNNTDPMFYYCSQARHCQNGMVGAVNAEDDAVEKYTTDAGSADENVSPESVFGGTVVENGSDDNDDDDSSSSMGMSSTMMGGGSMSSTMMGGGSMSTMAPTTSNGGGGGGSTPTDGEESPSETSPEEGAASGVRGSLVAALAGAVGVAAFMM